MDREENCSCGGHGRHHGEHYEERHEGHSGDCGCGGHEQHGINREWHHHGGCSCGCHQHHSGMRFHRYFISHEEIIAGLEEYLKQLQAEAKGVEERLAELKKEE
ncbi:MAG: hypothetical protein Q7T57_01425 [Dehalococcoidales bacterium]|nr:hypothetical protein [Dehalococcoidales bacterium]